MQKLLKPVVVVVGTTAVGKSDFAMALADTLTRKQLKLDRDVLIHSKDKTAQLISADALQIYKGLPIATNQPTKQELERVQHYCVAEKQVWEEYSVGEWLDDVLGPASPLQNSVTKGALEKIREQDKIPIIVGGTSYYVESLVFGNRLITNGEQREAQESIIGTMSESIKDYPKSLLDTVEDALRNTHGTMGQEHMKSWVEKHLSTTVIDDFTAFSKTVTIPQMIPTNILHELVQLLDPAMAKRWHPNDIRKLRRVVEVWYETGKQVSAIHESQKEFEDDGIVTRFPTVLVWVVDDWEAVRDRMESRVSKMTERGLIVELESLVDDFLENGIAGYEDGTRGVSQAIGFKEFKGYLDLYQQCRNNIKDGHPLDSETIDKETKNQLLKLRAEGLELMNIHTRQYAKRQITWLRNKLVHELYQMQLNFMKRNSCSDRIMYLKGKERPDVLVYLVHAENGHPKDDTVDEIVDIVLDFEAIHSDRLEEASFPLATQFIPQSLYCYLEPNKNTQLWTQYVCEVCSVDKKKVLNGEKEWQTHLQSASHRKRVRYSKNQFKKPF